MCTLHGNHTLHQSVSTKCSTSIQEHCTSQGAGEQVKIRGCKEYIEENCEKERKVAEHGAVFYSTCS